LAIIMRASVETTGASRQPEPPQQIFILPSELAGRLTAAGIGLEEMQQQLLTAGSRAGVAVAGRAGDIYPIVTGGPGVKMAYLPLWGGGSRMVTREIGP
jgi:hypothetical protein